MIGRNFSAIFQPGNELQVFASKMRTDNEQICLEIYVQTNVTSLNPMTSEIWV